MEVFTAAGYAGEPGQCLIARRRSPCTAGRPGEPGLGALVTGNFSPHSATTNVPMTALSAIFSLRT